MASGLINTSLEFAGLDDEYIPPSKNSVDIENKTNKSSNKTDTAETKFKKESQQLVEQSTESNVLNGYRSVTYNFTLACLKKEYLEKPERLRESELELVILKSGGKGYAGIQGLPVAPDDVRKSGQETYDRYDATAKRAAQSKIDLTNKNLEIVAGFNASSPGRFDMFIENLEIETLMSFTESSNTSLPTKIKFEVIEPFSVNGFIEALYVSAIAAGYPNYISAAYVLKLEFKGYPDGQELPNPVVIPNSTRYFPIGLTNIEVDISEKGTRYRVDAVPYNERSFGQSNTIKKPIKMEGQTVKDILTNFISNINKQSIAIWKESKQNAREDEVDTYDIKFPSWSETDGWQPEIDNAISKEKLIELYKDNALYNLIDPSSAEKPNGYKVSGSKKASPGEASSNPEKIKYDPTKTVVQFSEGMNIHDVISIVIRDSEYVRNILKDIKNHTDSYGMVDYFLIKIETTNTDVINDMSKKPVQKITYVVTPYKIHYSKIPNLADNIIDEVDLKKLSLREYNYIYTGKNVDVLNFKLNFNTLFFEAIPVAMGNKDVPEAKTAAGNNNNVKVNQASPSVDQTKQSQVPLPPKKPVPNAVQSYSGNASQPLDDPYSSLARNLHEAVVNSKASMITGELEILGDPFYLTTGGLGNYNPKPAGRSKTQTGEANQNFGQIMITINFRNPIDILPLEQGGTMLFDANRVPFSGVYMVTQANHTFKDGNFKQRLSIIRVPGQVIDYTVRPTEFTALMNTEPSPGDRILPVDTGISGFSQRLDSSTAFEQLSRGLPSIGLPGEASNFVSAVGGIGSAASAVLQQTPGVGNALSAGSSIIGQALPTDLTSNLRLNASGLSNLSLGNLNSAALTNAASNILTGNVSFKQAAGVLAGKVIGDNINSALKRINIGSGIGEGASIAISNVLPSDPTAQDIKFGETFNSASLPALSISDVGNSVKDLGQKALSAVENLGADAAQFVGNVGDKIKTLTSTPADPQAIGAALGIDASKLAGLDSKFQSKVLSQLKNMAANVPSDTNLGQMVSQGLVLDYIPSSNIKNIPAVAPYSLAPEPNVPNPVAGKASFNPLSNVSKFVSSVDSSIVKDKLQSATKQLSAITGNPILQDSNISGSVLGKYGSATSNPLDKLVNKLNDPNASPYTGTDPIVRARLGLPPVKE
jgi:hypothetical protein